MRKRRKARKRKFQSFFCSLCSAWENRKSRISSSRAEKLANELATLTDKEPDGPSPMREAPSQQQNQEKQPQEKPNIHNKWIEWQQEARSTTPPKNRSIAYRIAGMLRKSRRSLAILVILTGILGGVGAIFFQLRQKSEQREADLLAAVRNSDWVSVHRFLAMSDISVYRFFNSSLAHSMGYAESWQQRMRDLHARLQKKIENIESGQTPMNTLSVHAIAEIERTLRVLPADINDLSNRWSLLYANNRAILSKNRAYVINHLLSAPDIQSFLTLDVEQDCTLLNERIKEWEDCLETCNAYDIPRSVVEVAKQYLTLLKNYQDEAHTLQQFNEIIQEATTYPELQAWAKGKSAAHYPPARKAFSIFKKLPTAQAWQQAMQPVNELVPPSKQGTAKRVLLEAAPTFSAAFPATQRQYTLAQELFSTPPLYGHFYQVIHADGRAHISEEYPRVRPDDSHVTIQLSEWDPVYITERKQEVNWDGEKVSVRHVCHADMMKSLGIHRDTFFSGINMPQLLLHIAQYKDKGCSNLAKAFVYERVLTLLLEHPLFSQHLPEFCPTLDKDAKSFAKMRRKHAAVMHSGAWLLSTPQVHAAEQDFGNWFKARQNRNYNRELKNNTTYLFRSTPRYVGYINLHHQVILRNGLQMSQPLWYVAQDGSIKVVHPGAAPSDALPYSPLFIDSNRS